MGGVELSSSNYCPAGGLGNKTCVGWVETYFKDCLCNLNDEISFVLGIISLIFWGLAEIPQIFTNFHNKSASGLSLTFLFTWILGDIFNLFGCVLDPSTLPTQFFTALLYTATTIALVLQCIYYDHFLRLWKCPDNNKFLKLEDEKEGLLKPKFTVGASNSPVGVPSLQTRHSYYFMSGRTLASSVTPPLRGSYMTMPRSGPPALQHHDGDSSSEDETVALSITQPRSIPRHTAYGTFLAAAAAAYYPVGGKAAAVLQVMDPRTPARFTGRRLLLQGHEGIDSNIVGQGLGWVMAAIYMGGRIPQIWLNIKRGSVEGLNPLMFVFVLVANATYLGSILVRSSEWEKIKANMPWLVDAVACVLLDLFIIVQYYYYSRVIKATKKMETT